MVFLSLVGTVFAFGLGVAGLGTVFGVDDAVLFIIVGADLILTSCSINLLKSFNVRLLS